MSRVVICLHGIRTRGKWQKQLAPVLANYGFTPYLLDYGWFGIHKFLTPWSRRKQVDWLRDEIAKIREQEKIARPSVIAHSFGTYLVAELIRKYPGFEFDKIILVGSIVRQNFEWPKYLNEGRINLLRNDFGALDVWPKIARWCVPHAGNSGTNGFREKDKRIIDQQFAHRHSDYFHITHFKEHWIPILKKTVLSEEDREKLYDILSLAVQDVAQLTDMEVSKLRANIFTENKPGCLSIPPGLYYNMPSDKEQDIVIRIGQGCAGIAFQTRYPQIAVKGDHNWGGYALPDEPLSKLDQRLLWVIVTPIFDPTTGVLLGTLGLDGLDVQKKHEELYTVTNKLQHWTEELGKVFREGAKRG